MRKSLAMMAASALAIGGGIDSFMRWPSPEKYPGQRSRFRDQVAPWDGVPSKVKPRSRTNGPDRIRRGRINPRSVA